MAFRLPRPIDGNWFNNGWFPKWVEKLEQGIDSASLTGSGKSIQDYIVRDTRTATKTIDVNYDFSTQTTRTTTETITRSATRTLSSDVPGQTFGSFVLPADAVGTVHIDLDARYWETIHVITPQVHTDTRSYNLFNFLNTSDNFGFYSLRGVFGVSAVNIFIRKNGARGIDGLFGDVPSGARVSVEYTVRWTEETTNIVTIVETNPVDFSTFIDIDDGTYLNDVTNANLTFRLFVGGNQISEINTTATALRANSHVMVGDAASTATSSNSVSASITGSTTDEFIVGLNDNDDILMTISGWTNTKYPNPDFRIIENNAPVTSQLSVTTGTQISDFTLSGDLTNYINVNLEVSSENLYFIRLYVNNRIPAFIFATTTDLRRSEFVFPIKNSTDTVALRLNSDDMMQVKINGYTMTKYPNPILEVERMYLQGGLHA